ncbi:MAG: RNA polymerase sigma factor [Planctomycetota bacterium]
MRVWRRRERVLQRGRLEGYLYAAVRNLALDQLRRRRTREAHLPKLAVSILSQHPGGPDTERIDRALGELPAEQREVVALRVYLGLSFPEVAERVGCPLGTVHSRYRYAMTHLRARLVADQPPGGTP